MPIFNDREDRHSVNRLKLVVSRIKLARHGLLLCGLLFFILGSGNRPGNSLLAQSPQKNGALQDGPRGRSPDSAGRTDPDRLLVDDPVPTESLAEQLASPSYTRRKAAMFDSWSDYQRSRTAVWELSKSDDPETAARAKWIIERWEIGLLADLPPAVQRQLSQARVNPAAAIAMLIREGYLREAIEVARHHQLAADHETVELEIARQITAQYPALILVGQERGQLDLVLELLDQAATTIPLAVARAVLIERLGEQVTAENLLPACATDWPAARQAEAAVVTWSVLGRQDLAAAAAQGYQRADWDSTLRMLAGDWAGLATVAEQATEPDLPVEATLQQYVAWILAASYAGLEEDLRRAAAAMRQESGSSSARWRSLAVAGMFSEAIEVAQRLDPQAAADLLAGQQDWEAAFATLDLDPINPHSQLNNWLEIAKRGDNQEGAPQTSELTASSAQERIFVAFRFFRSIGDFQTSETLLRRLGDLQNSAKAVDGDSNTWVRAGEAALRAHRFGLNPLAAEIIAAVDSPTSEKVGNGMGYALTEGNGNLFQTVAGAVATLRPGITQREHWLTMLQLIDGELPAGWDRQSDLDRLFDASQPSSQATQRWFRSGRADALSRGDFFAALGRQDLAQQAYMADLENNAPTSYLKFADYLLASGEPTVALKYYERAYRQLVSPSSILLLRQARATETELPSACSALLGQAVTLRILGRIEESQTIFRALDLMPFQPANAFQADYFEQLTRLGYPERQAAYAPYELRFAAFDLNNPLGPAGSATDFYSKAIKYVAAIEADNPAEASLWHRIAVIKLLGSSGGFSNATAYLTLAANTQRLDALAALERDDPQAAEQAFARSLKFLPLNIDLAEKELLRVREAGHEAMADRLLAQMLAVGDEYLKKFPLDANTMNNMAWVAAINDKADDRALELARRAVFLAPLRTSYRDTLAEVLFRRGQIAAAIDVEQQCLLDEPDDWHLHEQLQRFSR